MMKEIVLFGIRGWSEDLPTAKNYASERTRLGIVAGFNTPECNGEPPPGAKAFLITLVPAPSKFNHSLTHTHQSHHPYLNLIISFHIFSQHKQTSHSQPSHTPHHSLTPPPSSSPNTNKHQLLTSTTLIHSFPLIHSHPTALLNTIISATTSSNSPHAIPHTRITSHTQLNQKNNTFLIYLLINWPPFHQIYQPNSLKQHSKQHSQLYHPLIWSAIIPIHIKALNSKSH